MDPRSAPARPNLPRRFLLLSLVFGLFILFDLALFSWLIFRSLSQREVERILLETREEAQGLASQIAGRAERAGGDLFTAVALEQETQTYIDSVLRQRDIVQTVEIRDKGGVLVLRNRTETNVPLGGAVLPPIESRGASPRVETRAFERQSTYEVTVPIGELGSLSIGISPQELEKRIGVLREELVREASLIGGVTLALLISAFLLIFWLVRRGRRLEEQAVESERLAYLGRLAAGLAHEIRNPLNSLNLNLQMLEEEMVGPAPAPASRRLLTVTQAEISRLERLVTDFLTYARPRPLELKEVPAIELLQHAREVLAGQILARRARVETSDETQGAMVKVDRAQINQLLLNLVQNALTATEESGREPAIRLAARRQGPHLLLEVSDNGAGIPPEVLPRVFELFFSTRKGGTGLGLAIVQRIARAHGGVVEIESKVGEGTTLTVALPIAAARRSFAVTQPSLETPA